MKGISTRRIAKEIISALLCVAMILTQLSFTKLEAKADTVYTVEASASKTTVTVGEEISLTAVIKADGTEMSNIYVNDQGFKFWTTGDNYNKATFTDDWSKDNCKVSFTEAGTFYITANYHTSSWTNLAEDYLTITVTDVEENNSEVTEGESNTESNNETNGESNEGTETGYNLTFELEDTTAEVGDTIHLTASLKKDGESITDLSAAGLKMWFWTDTWADGHSGGLTDATYSNKDADGYGFTADVTVPSAGKYYIACEVENGNTREAIKYIELTVSEPAYSLKVEVSDETPAPGDTVTLTATLKKAGTEVTDLAALKNDEDSTNNLYLYWYADKWIEGHENGLTGEDNVVLSDYDNNSGLSLSAKVKVKSEGKYYMVAKLQDSAWQDLKIVTVELTVENNTAVVSDIDVDKVSGLDADFIMGMDISSVISEFDSGVTFNDFDGNTISNVNDFCSFLASVGVNTIRVRVWNNPYDSNGNGYGGGNNDVSKAKTLADACRSAGLKMLVDFHCSDLWTDPGKYKAPKAWADYSVDDKATALKQYIKDSLNTIDPAKDVVTMVQVGNETTGGFVGESDNTKMCTLFKAGIAGVKEYNESVQTVVHVTNPEKSNMTKWAGILNTNEVDYDILATSYYPYWHGTLSNLKSQLSTVKSTYNKQVMVAETSYAYTLNDSDGHDNTVRTGHNDTSANCTEPFTVQGQATSIRNLIEAVSEAGGLGVFYWESAWITVGDTTGLTGDEYTAKVNDNKTKWEQYGSGWASSYASEYDATDAGQWYGGSAVDNEAMFYPDGTPTASIRVWNLVKTGAETSNISIGSITNAEEAIDIDGTYTLPSTIKVTYNKGSVNESVEWNTEDVSSIDVSKSGIYEVNGTVSLSKDVNTGDYAGMSSVSAKYILTVKAANLITDADDASFEKGTNFTISGSGISAIPNNSDPYAGSKSMHWWNKTACQGVVTYNKAIELTPGKYTFSLHSQGYAGDQVTLKILSEDEETTLAAGEAATLTGWAVWTEPSVSVTVNETTSVKLQIVVDIQAGGWGTADAMYFYQTESFDSSSESGTSGNNANTENSNTENSHTENNNQNSSEISNVTENNNTDSSDNKDSNQNTDTTVSEDAQNNTSNESRKDPKNEQQTEEEKTFSLFVPIYVSNNNNRGNANSNSHAAATGEVNNLGSYSIQQANQGPLCVQAFKNATPGGYSQIIAFDMVTDGAITSKNKNGLVSLSIPEQFQKAGRSFILLGVDKTGVVKKFTNTSKDGKTFTTNLNIDGYSFSLIYSDDAKAISNVDNVTIPKTLSNKTGSDNNGTYLAIKKGDSLSKMAKALNTTVEYLMKKNGITNPNKIKIGQKLYV